MKYNKWQTAIWVAIAVVALAWAPSAFANTAKFRVEIPFAFHAGGNDFDAGMYSVSYDAGTNLVRIVPDAGGVGAFALGRAAYRSYELDRGTMVFHKIDGEWALRSVWSAGRQFGAELKLPKSSRETAKWKTVGPEIAVLYALN